ncbi:hypothetical protein L1987_02563 [Smallanthus sonchifolius]|uniref:Uncharacterized protein n=1 Tax=Smallanthus sonchifolius TaxID=185202 RepID=A0ACB9K872_9ASTR|nr:hypothetical protein L1987_02563 [Smallanthus sonchifolius]
MRRTTTNIGCFSTTPPIALVFVSIEEQQYELTESRPSFTESTNLPFIGFSASIFLAHSKPITSSLIVAINLTYGLIRGLTDNFSTI